MTQIATKGATRRRIDLRHRTPLFKVVELVSGPHERRISRHSENDA